jgi:hypothetical protein
MSALRRMRRYERAIHDYNGAISPDTHTLVRANAATTLKDLDAAISGYGGVEKRRSSPRKRDGSADGLRVPLHVRDRIFSCAGADDAPCSLISAYSAISTSLAISFAAPARSPRSWDRGHPPHQAV